MTKKIMYLITSLAHKRVFESFEERDDMKQMVVGPKPVITSGIVPEDYSDFKIKNIQTYSKYGEIQSIVNKFKPDIFVQASLPCASGIKLSSGCKKVYVSHGMIGNHTKGTIKKSELNTSVWRGCDLYCGATKVFADWVKHVAKVDNNKILLNALPQLDILCDENYYKSCRKKILNNTNFPGAKKVILFVGFCCKDRYSFVKHNEDYFRSVLALEKIAKKNNWLVMVKPRHEYARIMKFLQTHAWGKKYIKSYANIQQSKHLYFITTTGHIYRYFFADAIVLNGTSTVEVEACAIKKPLFIVRTEVDKKYDPHGVLNAGAAVGVHNLDKLELYLEQHFGDGNFHSPDKQTRIIKDMEITFDGKMHARIQNKLRII